MLTLYMSSKASQNVFREVRLCDLWRNGSCGLKAAIMHCRDHRVHIGDQNRAWRGSRKENL